MNNTVKIIIACVVALAVGYVLGGAGKVPSGLGATIYNRVIEFSEGITVDGTERISGTGGASFTTGAFSSTLAVTGASAFTGAGTFSNTVAVVDSASSTLTIGSAGDSANSGCLVLGDSSATGTKVYITATGETISATTTKPAACQ